MFRKFHPWSLLALAFAAALPAAAQEVKVTTPTAPAAATGPQPKMVITETTFNYGDIPKGEAIVHDYDIKNTGEADLLILNVKPSCGCTTPGFDKVIAPGQAGKVSLKVDTSRFKGPISKSATVTTNDPNQKSLRLVLSANVTTFVDVLPRDAVTFRQYRGEKKVQELTIKSNEPGEFKINDVQVTGQGIQHELTKLEDEQYKLALWLDESAPIGNITGAVKLLTNSKKEPETNISVRGSVLGQITVNPSTLYFRVQGASDQLQVSANSANMRSTGDLAADVVAKLAKGAKLDVLEKGDEWTRVKTAGGEEGWVFNELVAPAAGGDAEGPAAMQTKVLSITHRQAGEFAITGSEIEGQKIDPKALAVSTETVREGQSYKVSVTYQGTLTKGNYTGSVVIQTSDSEEPEVRVPLYIVVT